jgi:hypothetical protein
MRSTTTGVVVPVVGQFYSASDVLQTTPPTITNPTYLASPGIQVGPGTDLVTKTAGDRALSTYVYPTTVYFGLKGNITSAPGGGWLWPGTQQVSAGNFPDPGIPPAYYRIQQPSILIGMYASCYTGPGALNTTTLLVQKTPVSGLLTPTVFTVTFAGTNTISTFYNGSVNFAGGDLLHLKLDYTSGSPSNLTNDLTVQLDLF